MYDKMLSVVQEALPNSAPSLDVNSTPTAIVVAADDIVITCETLYAHPDMYFDMLSCITGIDNGTATGTIEIAYNLYSIPHEHHLMLKVTVPRENASIDSVAHIWKTANWHERELFDMIGVQVKNHPDLRRILLPADWSGHPLRKDYKTQEYYKSIKVDY